MAASLEQVVFLARALQDADRDVELVTNKLKELSEKARILREETIPNVLMELGIKEFKLDSGEKVTIKQDVYASMSSDNKPAAFRWLDEHSFGGLIKTGVVVDFSRAEIEKAKELYSQLVKQKLGSPSLKQEINAQTFKAFLREQIAKGTDLPLDLFGARPVWTTKIK